MCHLHSLNIIHGKRPGRVTLSLCHSFSHRLALTYALLTPCPPSLPVLYLPQATLSLATCCSRAAAWTRAASWPRWELSFTPGCYFAAADLTAACSDTAVPLFEVPASPSASDLQPSPQPPHLLLLFAYCRSRTSACHACCAARMTASCLRPTGAQCRTWRANTWTTSCARART